MSNEELVERIRNGYHVTENMQVLYENNLPLIKKFIKPYAYYESEEDLLQEAYFGLWEAVRHYESSENVLFMTYARYWIKQSVQRYMENSGSVIRISSAYRQKIARYKKTVQEFEQTYGHTPTDEEIADYSLLPLSEIKKIRSYMQEIVSLDTPIKADDELTLSDTVADDFSLELRSQYFTFHIEDLENGIMGQTNFPERKIVIAPKYKNDKSVILHEMIHAYELTLQTEHSVLNELLLITLYNKLKPQIPELDKLISEHVELYGQHCVSISGGTHGLLFYLKSLDLDLRCEYKLGTVCGYGRDTGEMWYY